MAGSLVIFDCDGVLVDSESIVTAVHAAALNAIGYDITEKELLERYLGVPDKAMYAAIEADWGRALPPGYDVRAKQAVREASVTKLSAIEGVATVLDGLGSNVCVASSSSAIMLDFKLKHVKLYDRFAPAIFSVDDVVNGKPAPDLFLHAAVMLGFSPASCTVIEDSVNGVLAGKAAGMRVLGFMGASHISPGHDKNLIEAGADAVFATMAELPVLLA